VPVGTVGQSQAGPTCRVDSPTQRYVDSDFLFSFLCSLFTTQCGMSHTAFQLCLDLD
jgi:hypothetical protein